MVNNRFGFCFFFLLLCCLFGFFFSCFQLLAEFVVMAWKILRSEQLSNPDFLPSLPCKVFDIVNSSLGHSHSLIKFSAYSHIYFMRVVWNNLHVPPSLGCAHSWNMLAKIPRTVRLGNERSWLPLEALWCGNVTVNLLSWGEEFGVEILVLNLRCCWNTTAYLEIMAGYQVFNAFDHVKSGTNSFNLNVLFHSKNGVSFCTMLIQWLLIQMEGYLLNQQWYLPYLVFSAARPEHLDAVWHQHRLQYETGRLRTTSL